MSWYSLNLVLRFVLEIIAVISIGSWSYTLTDKPFRYLLAIGIPVLCTAIWGVFNVKGDPSRSGKAPVQVSGSLRLSIELAFFAFGCFAIYRLGYPNTCIGFALLTLLHYVYSFDRIRWLLRHW